MTQEQATRLWVDRFGRQPDTVRRFPTGLCHWVFEVRQGDERAVLRVASAENRGLLESGLGWLSLVGSLGVPVPKVLHHQEHSDPPYLVLEYLEGSDLGSVYHELTEGQRAGIARDLVEAHRKLEKLPPGPGFGFLGSYSDPSALPTWRAVLDRSLSRSRQRMAANGVFDPRLVDPVTRTLDSFNSYFDRVEPRPFFDDATTKNLLVHQGRMSGIVDLDWLCFGDRLFALALTRMSLLETASSASYVEVWAEEWKVIGPLERILDLYTLIFCLDFMGGTGMHFNKAEPPCVDPAQVGGLTEHYQQLSGRLGLLD